MTDPGAPDLPPFDGVDPIPASAAPPPPFAPAPPPTVPPAPAVSFAPPAATISYAGFWIRFVAVVIDAVILLVLRVGTGTVIRAAAGVSVWPLWSRFEEMQNGVGCAQEFVGIVVWWLYHALLESSPAQASFGKQALGLKVTDLQGRRISFARASARTFAKILSLITLCVGYVMAAFTARRQALHDFVAETVVLRIR